MEKLYIICVDDQREVLEAIAKDLSDLKSAFRIELCESAEEALEVIDDILSAGDLPALILSDHIMPGVTGVQFLTRIQEDNRLKTTRKILVTGLATHSDTIEAINKAGINLYIEKPWDKDRLMQSVKPLLTQYILEAGIDPGPYSRFLDAKVLIEKNRL